MLSPSSPEWQETKDWIGKRIEELRVQNEVPGLSLDETNVIRGRIAELRDFMTTVEPPKGAASEASPSYV